MYPVKQGVVILGATGTIGINTLAVIAQQPDHFYVVALVANRNVPLIVQQCQQCYPQYVVMADPHSAKQLEVALQNSQDLRLTKISVLAGEQAACQVVALAEVDQVMSAIVGAAGLMPTLAAIKAGKRILLANKESLITCGRLFMQAVAEFGATILPIDSEHNAIFQSLSTRAQQQLGRLDLTAEGIKSIILTGSGGPFRQMALERLAAVTVKQACAHPNWVMGPKISVDSATMMNKGLEYIEARWLFNASAQQMEILIHPQSVIHSMVRYVDGSVIAQLGTPDMQTPIAHAMAYPQRLATSVTALDFCQIQALTFQPVDYQRYPCLQLAIDAYQSGQAATTVLNAANEVAVAAFLTERIGFTEIAQLNLACLQQANFMEPKSIEEVLEIDQQARLLAQQQLNHYEK